MIRVPAGRSSCTIWRRQTWTPGSIRALALSHGHRDHTGGLAALLERRPGLPVYAHPDVLRERFSRRDAEMRAVGMPIYRSPDSPQEGGMRSIGMTVPPEDLRRRADLRLSPQPQEILPGVWTTGEVTDRAEPEGRSPYHFVRGEAGWEPDPYQDDMSLVLETGRGLALLCDSARHHRHRWLFASWRPREGWPCSATAATRGS